MSYKIDKYKISWWHNTFSDKALIKIITGIRRYGKSILLGQTKEELSINIDKEHMI